MTSCLADYYLGMSRIGMVDNEHRCSSPEEETLGMELWIVSFKVEIPSAFEDIHGVSSLQGSKTVGEENWVNLLSEMSKSSRIGSSLSWTSSTSFQGIVVFGKASFHCTLEAAFRSSSSFLPSLDSMIGSP